MAEFCLGGNLQAGHDDHDVTNDDDDGTNDDDDYYGTNDDDANDTDQSGVAGVCATSRDQLTRIDYQHVTDHNPMQAMKNTMSTMMMMNDNDYDDDGDDVGDDDDDIVQQ